MTKDYNAIKLTNGIQNAVAQRLADIAITGIEHQIDAYKKGYLTASELLQFFENIK